MKSRVEKKQTYAYREVKPKYYDKFRCIGGNCPDNCCKNWGYISWKEEEYQKLIRADMSEELREKLSSAFFKTINPVTGQEIRNIRELPEDESENMLCPMLTGDGWCSIQRELGAEYLSHTCMTYPRFLAVDGSQVMYYCTPSCPEVVNLLLNGKDAMELNITSKNTQAQEVVFRGFTDTEEQKGKNPILRYRNLMFSLFYSLLSNENFPIETGMVLGGIAAKRLAAFQEAGDVSGAADEIEALKEKLILPEQIDQINNIAPNYAFKLGAMTKLIISLPVFRDINTMLSGIVSDENPAALSVAKYESGKRLLAQYLEDKEYFIRNLALNMFIQLYVTTFRKEASIYDFWLYYCTVFSTLSLVITAMANRGKGLDEVLTGAVLFDKTVAHNHLSFNRVVDHLKENGYTKTAHIALMLK